MKKIFLFINLIFFTFLFSSCSNKKTEESFYDTLDINISFENYNEVEKRNIYIDQDGNESKYTTYGIIGLLIYSNQCSICKDEKVINAVSKAKDTLGFYTMNANENLDIYGNMEDLKDVFGFYMFKNFKTEVVPVFIVIYFDINIETNEYENFGYFYEYTTGLKVEEKILEFAEYSFY